MNKTKILSLKKFEHPLGKIKRGGLAVACLYPNSYFLGMSNLGIHSIYKMINNSENLSVERFFTESKLGKEYISFDNYMELGKIKFIIVSLSYEEDSLELLKILENSGISIEKQNRKDIFLMIGGMMPLINPKIFKNIADAVYLGYLGKEEKLKITECIQKFYGRKDMLKDCLKNIKGVWITDNDGFNEINYKNDVFEDSFFITKNTEFSNMFLMEIGRGCPFSCSFCFTGNRFEKPVWRDFKDIVESFEIVKNNKIENVGLIAPSPNAHPEIERILEYFYMKGVRISLSSMRAELLNDKIMRYLQLYKKNSITIAPETPNEKKRFKLGKKVKDIKYIESVNLALKFGIRNIKMYFLIGKDAIEDGEDVLLLKDFLSKLPNKVKIIASFNVMVPKPFTPMACTKIADYKRVKRIIKNIRSEISSFMNVKIKIGNLKNFYLQYKISNGDENLLFDLLRKEKNALFGKKL